MKYDVFISYRREVGIYQADALESKLKLKGWKTFLDRTEIKGGNWKKKLEENIRESCNFIVIISKGCFPQIKEGKDYFLYEINQALKLEKNVIPVYYDDMNYDSIKKYLSGTEDFQNQNPIVFNRNNTEGSVDQIISFLKTEKEILEERFKSLSMGKAMVRQELMLLEGDKEDSECPVCDSSYNVGMTYCPICGYKFFDELDKAVANSNEKIQEHGRLKKHKELWHNYQHGINRNSIQPNYELEEIKTRLQVSETKREALEKQLKALKKLNQTLAICGETIEFWLNDKVSFKMIRVEGGSFQMGSVNNDADAFEDEKPQHRVTLKDYYIGETVVTLPLWNAIMGAKLKYNIDWEGNYGGGVELPAYRVSWEDCREFIKRLKMKTGIKFRLPTEAEWEYAARGGKKSHGYKYAGGNNLDDVAWYEGNSSGRIHPVKNEKQGNELGLYDMCGNVWEWCQDWWEKYSGDIQANPKGASNGSRRVLRGGGWYSDARNCRVSNRNGKHPSTRDNNIGFRLALSQ